LLIRSPLRSKTGSKAVDGYCLLLVAHTILDEDDDGLAVEIIRIISARTADRKERRRYEETSR
jgi:uncharacterized DUF497 family protein